MAKLTTEVCEVLSIFTIMQRYREWLRHSYRAPNFAQHIHQIEAELPLKFTATSCRFGGRRWWLLCPTCGRRVGKLYRPGAEWFACRRCYGITYQACRLEDLRASSLYRRVQRISRTSGKQAAQYEVHALKDTARGRRLSERIAFGRDRAASRRYRKSREDVEQRAYDLYIKLLLPVIRT
jgi:Zn-finger nucleic acid-binding protein